MLSFLRPAVRRYALLRHSGGGNTRKSGRHGVSLSPFDGARRRKAVEGGKQAGARWGSEIGTVHYRRHRCCHYQDQPNNPNQPPLALEVPSKRMWSCEPTATRIESIKSVIFELRRPVPFTISMIPLSSVVLAFVYRLGGLGQNHLSQCPHRDLNLMNLLVSPITVGVTDIINCVKGRYLTVRGSRFMVQEKLCSDTWARKDGGFMRSETNWKKGFIRTSCGKLICDSSPP